MLAIRRAAAAVPKRAFASPAQAMGFSDIKDKEKAAEAVFFNKQDEKALRKLLQKMKGQTDVADKEGSKHHVEHDRKGLKSIPGLNLNEEQVNALLKWKHQQ
ncbi:uncharacterized protein PITG_06203 [Phytophthora infestans T30-4]|uniref:Uncharacterized protein n=2 Tax=Phytophthora infestans TaxID=4787 RepID=D0N4B5_PHYIT|nr:uncharacterized protein PITG_06203 [Phytophthora infestans T30-4]EEY69723.1 conserved hypothetical protein [Phytophthora infestans T30-4]KAF4144121.1 hypothetical protein GN958_ATG06713 [Phytophthora infestans]KAI9983678.1 hypothetical protein PInf_007744 [Phytophthora infestans]|eukprot:XP_002998370.1 conserved hypothetical protein [Phytophthora infestans T30-4]